MYSQVGVTHLRLILMKYDTVKCRIEALGVIDIFKHISGDYIRGACIQGESLYSGGLYSKGILC